MSELAITIFETLFNVLYLVAIWWIVAMMTRNLPRVSEEDRRTAGLLRLAFILLAAGDTGHVGFRVLAQAMGGLDHQVMILGSSMHLVGLGMLTTAVTVTLFYMLMVHVWRVRFEQSVGWFTSFLLAVGVIRLIVMALPGNDWGSLVPPQPMSLYRNLPLVIQGVGVMGLFLYNAYRQQDRTFIWIGWMIAVSYAFYTPVILFAQTYPLIGMLMIPKTCAYVAIAILAYQSMWRKPANASIHHSHA